MWLCRVMWSIYTYMFSFSGAHANRLHMEILTGQKRTTRVSKVLVPAAFCSLWWFLPWTTPPPLASWSASPAPFWPLHLHQLVLLWWLPLRRESLSPSLPPETWPGSLLTSHTLPGAPTHGFPTTGDYQIPSLSRGWFSGLQNQVCVSLLHIPTSLIHGHLKHTVSKTRIVFPPHTPPLLHPLAQWACPSPNMNRGVIWDFSLFLAPKLLNNYSVCPTEAVAWISSLKKYFHF